MYVWVTSQEIVKPENFHVVTREIFGPFQIVTDYKDDQIPLGRYDRHVQDQGLK